MIKMLRTAFLFLLFANTANSQSLLHYWNFNDNTSPSSILTPTVASIAGAGITHIAGGTSVIDAAGGTGQNFNIDNLNTRNSSVSGTHLRFNNPIGGALVFALPTTGATNIVIKYATRRSGSGAGTQVVEYSTDGTAYLPFTTIIVTDGNPVLQTLDFSGTAGVNNNANFKIRITFEIGAGGNVGNNRFDNFTVDGTTATDAVSPTIAFTPVNGSANIPVAVNPSITFNEDVRMVDNTLLDNTNVDNLLELRQTDAAGQVVAFDATVSGRVITIVPSAPLLNNQQYYIALKANTIEDLSNNVIATVQSAIFTTIPVQTIFLAGDLVPVAYRMNATGTEDEIGLLTFVDILPGTLIQLTDAKYTDNAQAQCPGGITWTAPAGGVTAGTVIRIQTSALVASTGTLTGSGFGLSSGGDQVIVYTGTATNPSYITALSSNNWLLSATDCGGSNSKLPTGLTDGQTSINLSNAPGNASANSANAYYNGIQSGTPAQLKAAILNATNWVVSASGTAAQSWPAYAFPGSVPVGGGTGTIGFLNKFMSINESGGSVTITLKLEMPGVSSADLVLKGFPFSNTSEGDITFATTTLNFDANSNLTQTITIPIIDDALAEMDEYFVLSLENLQGVTLKDKQYITIYIKDNDRTAPIATQELKLKYTGSFQPNAVAGSTTEIVAYDALSQKLFMTSAIQDRLDIASFANPAAISLIRSIDMSPYGGITSVAVKNGVVAVACPNANEQLNGSVVFFNTDGDFQKQVTVGALPDMITFSPDGNKIMTANEGQPNISYTVDPEGSVSIIDISGGIASVDQSKVITLLFTAFNTQEEALISAGIRKTYATSTLSQDLEPEYVTISPDSKKAWVTIQENNAIAEINLETNTITSLWPLGKKDFNTFGSGLDASDNSGVVHISNYPIKSFFMPDGIGNFTLNNKTYLVTANEGDEKEYGSFVERTTVGSAGVILDPIAFPNAAVLKEDHNLGRMRISNLSGDTDKDGDYDELMMVGARSFSIWDADTKTIVYDSKDDFEMITSRDPALSAIFNADNENNTFKSRSRAKGPEPEGVTVATINNKVYAFVGIERIGGVMVYNITDPNNVIFVDYKNSRNTSTVGGDLGPEGIIYIPATQSPDGKAYVAVANELSGTVSVYELEGAAEGPLPVSLISFQAKPRNNTEVVLSWSTASEQNNDYFTIERSTDGINYTKLATVKSKGESVNRQDYVYTDNTPANGTNYYRLFQTDKDGKKVMKSTRTAIIGQQQVSDWRIYPNPVTGTTISVMMQGYNREQAEFRLFSISGELIYAGRAAVNNGILEINLPAKPASGTYLLSINGLAGKNFIIRN